MSTLLPMHLPLLPLPGHTPVSWFELNLIVLSLVLPHWGLTGAAENFLKGIKIKKSESEEC